MKRNHRTPAPSTSYLHRAIETRQYQSILQYSPAWIEWQVPVVRSARFIVIGDIHGSYETLQHLIHTYGRSRHIVSLGDVLDRGSDSWKSFAWLRDRKATIVCGNHEWKHLQRLHGEPVTIRSENRTTIREEASTPRAVLHDFLLWGHQAPLQTLLLTPQGKYVATGVHAAMKPEYIGSTTANSAEWSLYGYLAHHQQCSYDWYDTYRGPFTLFGHMSTNSPLRGPDTLGLDTGCVYGGRLSAWIFPENRVVSVPLHRRDRTKMDRRDDGDTDLGRFFS